MPKCRCIKRLGVFLFLVKNVEIAYFIHLHFFIHGIRIKHTIINLVNLIHKTGSTIVNLSHFRDNKNNMKKS
mgnify:CR=1 FL=1